MPFARRTAALALAAALGGLAAPASPAQAAPRPGPETPSVLLLTVDDGAGLRATVLTCGPTGGLHPDPITACRLVARVDGDLDALDVDGAPCTSQYDPVVARAVGIWQDRPVSYTRTFGNACLMQRTTASLFTF
ncbi:SSI family serine proteinase inhibitor [Micromonospora aurantiaca]|uniref:SSI family serine proteinase inhibitor n=1 Tax=Micromonospora TaxID=1873 RepID=UPI0001BF2895|nr:MULTISPECIES: SSI family serine proteinase inhibitor [Micromonospora]ADL46806.1 proteinase inhibitor I16 subtilisin-type inhibitor [Micromonospora aurantiaca ATCC 27029]MDG4751795.1 SSI family serine proteinase inhibitor [Micromonospora sp. WMMD718]OHX02193.1 proteinase inhibitor I4 serpin [Micromonospora sp. WMMB235]